MILGGVYTTKTIDTKGQIFRRYDIHFFIFSNSVFSFFCFFCHMLLTSILSIFDQYLKLIVKYIQCFVFITFEMCCTCPNALTDDARTFELVAVASHEQTQTDKNMIDIKTY